MRRPASSSPRPAIGDARVRAVFDAYPADVRSRLLDLRALILETAAALPETGGLTETLKWGQPAYLPKHPGVGTTVRIDALRTPRTGIALYVHCQTSIARQVRDRYPGLFEMEGDRALLFAAGAAVPQDELRHCIGLALTYHAAARSTRRGTTRPGSTTAMSQKPKATLYGIKNCDTMKKARAWLDAHGIAYEFHDYKSAGIARDKLAGWARDVGWERLLNRAGTTFRKLPDEEKAGLTEKKALALMERQPSMIKRPVLDVGGELMVGFDPPAYEKRFGSAR